MAVSCLTCLIYSCSFSSFLEMEISGALALAVTSCTGMAVEMVSGTEAVMAVCSDVVGRAFCTWVVVMVFLEASAPAV